MSEEFCTGVRVLLERMKTNPEEFVRGLRDPSKLYVETKWGSILDRDYLKSVLTDAEFAAIEAAIRDIRREQFTANVMRTILGAEEKRSVEDPFKGLISGAPGTTITDASLREVIERMRWEQENKVVRKELERGMYEAQIHPQSKPVQPLKKSTL